MRRILTFLILFIGLISYCQTNVEQRDPINQNDYEFLLMSNNSAIRISKYKSSTINEISLILKTEADACNPNSGIILILNSGEKLSFENIKVSCSESETKKYNLTGSLILTSELYNKLSKSEIKEFIFFFPPQTYFRKAA